MTLLLDDQELRARRTIAAGPLNELATSLASDLHSVMVRGIEIPDEKAHLTRRGGRCEVDGSLLEFHPWSPRKHLCRTCGRTFDAEEHYRWWVMGFQLWLAERTVHAATLFAVSGDPRYSAFVVRVLEEYADRYLEYPNRDNVLGPTRVFFSTYLELIWLLQLMVAVDLLERTGASGSLGALVRERIVEPSARLIASYDEHLSNRQVWNNAALCAAGRLLDEPRWLASSLTGDSGLFAHLEHGLLADGSWYEGENYHLFAHRGLWYGVELARAAAIDVPPSLLARFDEGFATPFLTALPDFTFPSRRDSQYAVSLRQWRFAELCELGLARRADDPRLLGALATLYEPQDGLPRRDTGRWRSTAEAERNLPASPLSRTDLGWRSLLCARAELPPLEHSSVGSVLLEAQGFACLRRDAGATYVAIDYGHSGAGHGHPDRLNVMLHHGADRCLDDVGTGSYVDPTLHWYRSTLAHNAPLIDGRSQRRVSGRLLAFDERGGAGWVRAAVDDLAPGVRIERTVVVMPGYLIDQVAWRSPEPLTLDLPYHADGEVEGVGAWEPGALGGGTEPENGFSFLTGAASTVAAGIVRLGVTGFTTPFRAWIAMPDEARLWRATGPGAPGAPPARFHLIRVARAASGVVRAVWCWNGDVVDVAIAGGVTTIQLRDGARHAHAPIDDGWHISLFTGGAHSSIDLGGARPESPAASSPDEQRAVPRRPLLELPITMIDETVLFIEHPLANLAPDARRFALGEADYRRSEETWTEAGSPAAIVSIAATRTAVLIDVDVVKPDLAFAAATDWNPLDNEHPDTNSDGVQLHLANASDMSGHAIDASSWILVPEEGGVRITPRAGGAAAVRAEWTRLARGYRMRAWLDRALLELRTDEPFLIDVIVNETSPARERRRGQLVLSGIPEGAGWIYLRGDRQAVADMLPCVITDGAGT